MKSGVEHRPLDITRSVLVTAGLVATILAVLTPIHAGAQTGSSEADSLRFYELSEIVVGGDGSEDRRAETGAVHRISLASIVRTDAPDVAGLARLIPSAHLQTNSRGESLVYLRASGERQVAVFLDGALLNVPWDNRVDLSALPSSILGGMTVAEGASSVLYGTNVPGGVVNLSTRSLEREGGLSELTLVGGTAAFARGDGMHIRRKGASTLVAAAGVNRSDGFRLGENADLAFGQDDGELRTNTDRRIAHGYVRATRSIGESLVGISVLHVDALKGVAPEGHLDPAMESVRYWRYPNWRTSMITATAATGGDGPWKVRGAAWVSRFEQEIDQYASAVFTRVLESQQDRDLTGGLRVSAERPFGGGVVRGAVNGLVSRHAQTDTDYSGATATVGRQQRYAQHTWSTGAEYVGSLGSRARFVLGGNLDLFATPVTDDKPSRASTKAWGSTAALEWDLSNQARLHGTVGRKVRFPTMRELFGTALNRFLPNDELRPESAWLIDVGVSREGERGVLGVTGFFNRTFDTIDQENVEVAGERRRRRINLPGSRVTGVELIGNADVTSTLEFDFSATVLRPRAIDSPGRDVLVEKPEALLSVGAGFAPRSWMLWSLEAVHTGRAYGLDEDNGLVALPEVVQWNARFSARRYTASGVFAEVFVRADNITDQSVLPQLGLPGPGRMLQVGLSLAR